MFNFYFDAQRNANQSNVIIIGFFFNVNVNAEGNLRGGRYFPRFWQGWGYKLIEHFRKVIRRYILTLMKCPLSLVTQTCQAGHLL